MANTTDLILSTIFMIFVSVVAVIGNAMIVLAVSWNKKLRTIANVLFLNLAIADLFQGLVSIPLRLAEQLNQTSQRPLIPCLVVIPLTIFFYGASNLNVTIISLDRFIALYKPMKYRNIVTPVKAGFLVCICWGMMFILAIMPVVGWGATENSEMNDICLFTTVLKKEYLFLLFSVINLSVIIILSATNVFILKTARNQIRRIHVITSVASETLHTEVESTRVQTTETPPTTPGSRRSKFTFRSSSKTKRVPKARASMGRQRRATKVVLGVVGLFVVLTTPITVIDILGALGNTKSPPILLTKIAVCMVYSNACVNVFIYAGYNTEMRETWIVIFLKVREAFRKALARGKVPPGTSADCPVSKKEDEAGANP